jgi:hypothetical protein
MARSDISITIPDLAKWKAKLNDSPPITTRGVKKAMTTAAKESTAIFKRGAPRLTGKLGGSARPQATAMAAKVLFDPVASQGKGKGKNFRSGYALDSSSRFPSTQGYRDRIKAQVAAGPARRAAAEIGKEIERLWRA